MTFSVLGRAAVAPERAQESAETVSSRRDSLTTCRLRAAMESAHES